MRSTIKVQLKAIEISLYYVYIAYRNQFAVLETYASWLLCNEWRVQSCQQMVHFSSFLQPLSCNIFKLQSWLARNLSILAMSELTSSVFFSTCDNPKERSCSHSSKNFSMIYFDFYFSSRLRYIKNANRFQSIKFCGHHITATR